MSDTQALHAKLQDFRKRITRGEEVTDDELRTAIAQLHAYRAGAHTTLEAAATKKATKATTSRAKTSAKAAANNLLAGLL